MYLVYLAESGHTGNSSGDPNQPHHVHVGLLVHESQSISMNGEFNALYRRHFGGPPGEPGLPKELKPADIYQGRGAFRSWDRAKRNELIEDCLSIMIRRETPMIVSYMEKTDYAQARASGNDSNAMWQTPSEPIISRFLIALNLFMDELNMSGLDHQQVMGSELPIKDFALVVASDGRSVEPRFMTEFLTSEDGVDASALLENFCFVGPQNSVGTQLARMGAYFIRRWLQSPSLPQPYFDALRDNRVIQVIYPVQV